MSDATQLKTWVSSETKTRFAAVAHVQGMSESAALKRLVELMLRSVDPTEIAALTQGSASSPRSTRLMVRLRPDDHALLRERAAARGMPPATYVSVLMRAHLRSLAPLPKDELLALKRVVSELGSIGRNLNQIARSANRSQPVTGPGRDDLRAILRACEGVRDHVRALLIANLRSWEQGYAENP